MQPQKLQAQALNGLVMVREPLEGAYTILMPEGWTHQAHLLRDHSLNRPIASAISPDQLTSFHFNDPRLPMFVEPSAVMDPMMLAFNPHMRMVPYTPADYFFQDYAQQCFGPAPGFQLLKVSPDAELNRIVNADLRKHNHPYQCSSASVIFQYVNNGKPMTSQIRGYTVSAGTNWVVSFFALTTAGKLEDYQALAMRIWLSCQFNPQWAAAQQQLHNQRMQLGQQQLDHIQAMTNLQAQGHQQRMHDIAQAGYANTQIHNQRMAQHDAQMQSWQSQQSAMDQAHQSWMQRQVVDDQTQQARINAIRFEHTVEDSSGNTYQVDASHERYYVNARDNTYIGVSATTELEDLRKQYGVNPDDYREVKVVR